MPDVETTVLRIIAQKADVDPASLNRDTELSTLTFASIDTLETIFEIEEIFDISILYNANEAAGGFKTAGDVVNLVRKYIDQKNERLPN